MLVWGSLQTASGQGTEPSTGSETSPSTASQGTKILITTGSNHLVAMMDDNPTARDFVSMLPLTVTLRDFSPAEKVSDGLSKRLSKYGAPASGMGMTGDIAYYSPWGNLAFYRGQGPDAAGVIKIAKIISGIEILNQSGTVRATITLSEKSDE